MEQNIRKIQDCLPYDSIKMPILSLSRRGGAERLKPIPDWHWRRAGKFACRRGFQSGSAKCEPATGLFVRIDAGSAPLERGLRSDSRALRDARVFGVHGAPPRGVALGRVARRVAPPAPARDPGARVAPRVERGILRSRPVVVRARGAEDAVLDSARAHGDERVPGETQVGRRAVHGPDAVRHAAHGARRGAGGGAARDHRCAPSGTAAPRRVAAAPRDAHGGPRVRAGAVRQHAPRGVRARARARVPRFGRRKARGRGPAGLPRVVRERDARRVRRRKRVVVRPLLGGRNLRRGRDARRS